MKIIIIGGVAAGMSAAAKIKRLKSDIDVDVYEKTDNISWGACGLPYYIGEFFEDKKRLIARTTEEFEKTGVNIKKYHEVMEINKEQKKIKVKNLVNNEIFEDSYDNLIIATGASALIPPIKNINTEGVYTLKTFDDGMYIKEYMKRDEIQDIVIVGAGYIGIEILEAAKNINKKNIRIIQLGDRVLMESFDKEITDIMADEIRSHKGVELNLEEMVLEIIEKDGKVVGIKTDKGEYKADIVVVATGIRPNTKFLENLELETLRNGALVIDRYGRTSIPSIYAAGDCASVYHRVRDENVYIPLATTANKLGRIIGENICGLESEFPGTLGSAAVKIMDMEAGRTGITEKEAINMGIDYDTAFIKDKNQTGYYPGQENIYIKIIYNAKTKVILGAQAIGKKGVVLRVDALAVAIYSKLTVGELGMMDFCYAPPFSKTWDSMNVIGNTAK